jgi:SAM-dependent methyltransferase
VGGDKMEYMGDKEYWEKKFANRSDHPLSPEKTIVENIACFKKGSILDIACGDGRNTLFFLENGFEATGVDFSSKALERLRMFAKRNKYIVGTEQIDINMPNALRDIGVFDNVVINHYRLNKKQLEEIKSHIAEDGILFICGFGYKHQVDSKIRKEDLIQSTDFENIKKSFALMKYIENQDDRGFFVTYIFRKKKEV